MGHQTLPKSPVQVAQYDPLRICSRQHIQLVFWRDVGHFGSQQAHSLWYRPELFHPFLSQGCQITRVDRASLFYLYAKPVALQVLTGIRLGKVLESARARW